VTPSVLLLAALAVIALAVLVFWPTWGLVHRWRLSSAATDRARVEDALKHLWDAEYRERSASLESLAGALELSGRDAAALVDRLGQLDLVLHDERGLRLTVEGRRTALRVIRIHRLWERYLADETGLDASRWHEAAERQEHRLTDAQADALAAALGHPRFDPHGDPIPMATGEVPPHQGRALTQLAPDQVGTIIHIEDEPETVFAQIAAAGLVPGMRVRVLERLPHRVRIVADSEEVVLAPVVAANVTVERETETVDLAPSTPLSALAPGESGEVVALSASCRGAQRRRLLDLGVVPGTRVRHELSAPGGDPMACRVRGALIALRRDQAALIHVNPTPEVRS
jgi:DtxR family Mn-dependent transcriptional regulator